VSELSDQLNRILAMIPYIQDHPGLRVAELADYLGCAPEQAIADLDAVLLCGVPPYLPSDYVSVVVENDRIYIAFADHFRRPVNLTLEEALGLTLALDRLPLSKPNRKAAQSLRAKIAAALPSGTRKAWRKAARQVQVGELSRGVRERVAVLEQAVEESRVVHIEYYTAGRDEMTSRDVRPYGIIEHDGEWYLVGHCELRDRELPFRVDRVRAVEMLDRTFEPPKSFNREKYSRKTMYFRTSRDIRVKLRIAPDLARWLKGERPLGRMKTLPDGGLILYMSVSQPEWILSWVMSHAGQVELLAPVALRRMLVKRCEMALEAYE